MEGKALAGRQEARAGSVRALTPLQQILLTTDGTVTHILEAYAGEPMRVVKLSQAPVPSTAQFPELGLAEHETLLRRTILLRGSESDVNFIYADSLIVPNRLPRSVRDGLTRTDKPLGRLLLEDRTENFRDIVASWQEAAGDCAPHFAVQPTEMLICRTYHVLAGRQLNMIITEKFPATSFLSLPEHPRLFRGHPDGQGARSGQ